jgi:hypothetical protein
VVDKKLPHQTGSTFRQRLVVVWRTDRVGMTDDEDWLTFVKIDQLGDLGQRLVRRIPDLLTVGGEQVKARSA